MTLPNHFKLHATDGQARTGELQTPHGVVRTPAFMPRKASRNLHAQERSGEDMGE